MTPVRLLAQALLYALFMAFVGYFSFFPSYELLSEEQAIIRLSFSHGSTRSGDCRRFTPEEIAALPASERRPSNCERERLPVLVELYVDGEQIYRASLRPSGIAKDGPSTVYERFQVPVGSHHIRARLRDSDREEGFDYEAETTADLAPLESFVIDFRSETGGFKFL